MSVMNTTCTLYTPDPAEYNTFELKLFELRLGCRETTSNCQIKYLESKYILKNSLPKYF